MLENGLIFGTTLLSVILFAKGLIVNWETIDAPCSLALRLLSRDVVVEESVRVRVSVDVVDS
jgi:hypothetical protein